MENFIKQKPLIYEEFGLGWVMGIFVGKKIAIT